MKDKNKKWDFEDYAFTLAGVLCAVPMILGARVASLFDHAGMEGINRWWPFSWMSFMVAWSACLVKEVIDIKRGKEDASLEDAVETALYVSITTIMLIVGIIRLEFYSSWLAGPIVFVLLTVIWPLLRSKQDRKKAYFPKIPFTILVVGVVAEIVIGGWVIFPVSWIIISAVKIFDLIRKYKLTEEVWTDIMYHAFTVILLTASLIWGSWFVSWLAYPASVIISKIICKLRRGKKIS
ncbi:MAG: hypothetical protein FWC78_02580 [Defluviitaleaceae bacterium]|nr:hypothetical protein [Defluviitaleaceae bacterium]